MILTLTAILDLAILPVPTRTAPDTPARAPAAIAQSKDSGKKKKVIRLEALTVEGRIQKPQAFYILQRSNLNFEELNRAETFIPKVEKSVDNEPF
ncbi:MAG: hypothetical protein IRZ16_18680 [Myxococcaceae bacterium]|nr:hypothetical protein [Myxococcaceae bacterium]